MAWAASAFTIPLLDDVQGIRHVVEPLSAEPCPLEGHAPPGVLSARDRFEMRRVHAVTVEAEVVDGESIWDRSIPVLIGESVSL
jgi:hypothetical protein